MGTTTKWHDAKVAMADALEQLEGLAGVTVATAHLGKDTPRECVLLLGSDTGEEDWGAIGRLRRDETIVLRGVVHTRKGGGGEPTIRAVRERCVEIYGEVQAWLRTQAGAQLGGVVKHITSVTFRTQEGITGDRERFCEIEFFISGKSQLDL